MNDLVVTTIALLLSWFCVIYLAPQALKSVLRHRFWKLRDQLVDDIIDKKIANSPAARTLLKRIEKVIQHAEDLTLWNLLFLPSLSKKLAESFKEMDEARLNELSTQDKQIIEKYESNFSTILCFHLALTTPLGWMLSVVGIIWAMDILVTKGIKATLRPFATKIAKIISSLLRFELEPRCNLAIDFFEESRSTIKPVCSFVG